MPLKIRVRPDLCAGMGLCASTAPRVFQLDEHGYNKMDGEIVPAGLEDEAQQGASVCPEAAISLIEVDED
jgi:ferredoxin